MNLLGIHADGPDLRDETGKVVKLVGVDAFPLLVRWRKTKAKDGIDGPTELVLPILNELTQVAHEGGYEGPITLRAFRHAAPPNQFAIDPNAHADYYESAAACTDFCGEHGFYVDWTGGDAQIVFPSADPNKANRDGPLGFTQHVNDFTAKVCLGRKNAFFQLLNEPFKNGQVQDVPVPQWDSSRPILRDSGAFGEYNETYPDPLGVFRPILDRVDYHGTREVDKWFWPKWIYDLPVSAAVLRRAVGVPVIFGEEDGADETDQPGRRSNNPIYFFLLGLMIAFVNGVYFHSQDGAEGNGFRPRTRECAVAFFRGARAGLLE